MCTGHESGCVVPSTCLVCGIWGMGALLSRFLRISPPLPLPNKLPGTKSVVHIREMGVCIACDQPTRTAAPFVPACVLIWAYVVGRTGNHTAMSFPLHHPLF